MGSLVQTLAWCLVITGMFWTRPGGISGLKPLNYRMKNSNPSHNRCCCPSGHQHDNRLVIDEILRQAQHEGKLTRSKSYLRLRPNLQEGRDFALVPAEVWKALVA